jgi:hypothetical protein
MRFSAVLPLLYIAAASARATWLGGNTQDQGLLTTLDDLKVPGKNPLSFCSDASEDLLLIEWVDLDPNPPEA